MTEPEEFVYERVDDIPLLLALMIKMQIPFILDKHLGNHGHQQGLTNGWVAGIWLAYILSQGKHTKMHVQEWVLKRHHLLQELIGETIRAEDFTDDSLSLILKRADKGESALGVLVSDADHNGVSAPITARSPMM